jgi:uncharacterized protein
VPPSTRRSTITTEANQVHHDAGAHRFTLEVEGLRAVLDYTVSGDVMSITHTGVPPAIGGRGIAGELMRAAIDAARTAGWRINPVCSYAADYLAKHPEQAQHVAHAERQHTEDLLDEALDESFPASDPPSVGASD